MTTFFPDISLIFSKMPDISLTAVKFPDISRFSRQVVLRTTRQTTTECRSEQMKKDDIHGRYYGTVTIHLHRQCWCQAHLPTASQLSVQSPHTSRSQSCTSQCGSVWHSQRADGSRVEAWTARLRRRLPTATAEFAPRYHLRRCLRCETRHLRCRFCRFLPDPLCRPTATSPIISDIISLSNRLQ